MVSSLLPLRSRRSYAVVLRCCWAIANFTQRQSIRHTSNMAVRPFPPSALALSASTASRVSPARHDPRTPPGKLLLRGADKLEGGEHGKEIPEGGRWIGLD